MEKREQLQREVLQELIAYSEKLIPALDLVIGELKNGRKEDTSEFLNDIIKGINWEIEVYNQCAALINSKSNYIDKKEMIAAVTSLGQSLNSKDDQKIAECLEVHFVPFLNKLSLASKMVVA